ncbi:hypothetical protein SUGI_0976340 [Cryptomeria japonica]|uniref:uncharacterized protein LOC131049458 n=1 Tax=Cryptomeria japonica TaxID=3369 RepID=UPI002414C1D8|nr:uncharacterized protein LOC131049458 [Cryptomeria japonica]GLJ46323.1 hypothetical protein SUGI_0976340 [Cryptomeria japonica]
MAVFDIEFKLQLEIINWECTRSAKCVVDFDGNPGHMKLGMRGLLWSIQTLELQNPGEYSFNIMEVKRSETPLSLSEAAAPNLPAKFDILLADYKASMQSVRRADEALDKLYAFVCLFSLAEKDKRWRIIVDAEITAMACKCAKEAIYQAAQAMAAILVDQLESPVLIGGQQSENCKRSGWWIDNWTVADELWATGFFPPDSWKCMLRQFQAKALERGNVVQWCTVENFKAKAVEEGSAVPYFTFEVALQEFLDGDDVLLRIGMANDRALTVRVFLTQGLEVVCSQEGVETRTSLGLAYLLPKVAKDYIKSSLERNEAELSNDNVVQGLLQQLIRHLAFLGTICVICGKDRLGDVPLSSTCPGICDATNQSYKDVIAACVRDRKISEEARAGRREQYVKNLYTNSTEGRRGLGTLLNAKVVSKEETSKHTNDGAINYEEAVGRVTKMNSRSVAMALDIPVSDLWIDDVESFEI